MVARTLLDDGMATPMIISESGDFVVIALEMQKASIHRHRRFLESLLAVVRGYESLIAVAEEEQRDGD